MNKKTVRKKAQPKGFFRKAGEVIGAIGHELTEGKEKVVEVSQTVIEGINSVIKPAKKKAAKKTVKKTVKKAAKKAVKKIAKKAVQKKAGPKKAAVKVKKATRKK